MVLVVALMGAAAIMSYAVLGSSLMRAQAAGNNARARAADALAESGVGVAMYYLQNPASAPTLNADGYWPGANNLSLGTSVPGTVNVTVSRVTGTTYTISSTGRVSSGGDTVQRTAGATVLVNAAFKVLEGLTSGTNITIVDRMTVTNLLGTAVRSNGTVTISSLGRITGNVLAGGLSNGGVLSGIFTPSVISNAVPTASQIKDFRTYTYNDQTYSAQKLNSNTITGTLGPTPSNPAGVYWNDTATTLGALAVVNGTLILRNGATLNVSSGNKVVTAAAGMPALVIDGSLRPAGGSVLTVNGLVYARQGITGLALSTLVINGSIMFGEAGVASTYRGAITVLYNAASTAVPDFSTELATPQSIKVLSWNPSGIN